MGYKRYKKDNLAQKISTSKNLKWLEKELRERRKLVDLHNNELEVNKPKISEIRQKLETMRKQEPKMKKLHEEGLKKDEKRRADWFKKNPRPRGLFEFIPHLHKKKMGEWEERKRAMELKWKECYGPAPDFFHELQDLKNQIYKWEEEDKAHQISITFRLEEIEEIEQRIATVRRIHIREQEKRDLIAKAKGDARAAAHAVKSNLKKTPYCPYCNNKFEGEAHADHIVPLAAGGSSFETNMVYVCAGCNLSKGSLTLLEFCEKQDLDFMKVVQRLRKLGKRV